MSVKLRACRRTLWKKLLLGGWFALVPLSIGIANLAGRINHDSFRQQFLADLCSAAIPLVLYWPLRWVFGPIVTIEEDRVRWVTLDGRFKSALAERIQKVDIVAGLDGHLLLLRPLGEIDISIPVEIPAQSSAQRVKVEIETVLGLSGDSG